MKMKSPLFQQSLQEVKKSEDLHQLIQDSLVEVQKILIILDIGGIPAEVQADGKEVEIEKEREIPEGKEIEMKENIIKEESNTCIFYYKRCGAKPSSSCLIPVTYLTAKMLATLINII
uniref:Uncharacterized protein n=1 Tax=Micrurus lemniscatus lemniscatus TaxID=129467 RepID=A0A2D4HKL0_MICLE